MTQFARKMTEILNHGALNLALLAEAGFEDVTVQEMKHDPFNLHYLCRVPS